ncbi:MAG TPA: PRC-barrel domain-containing protein [Hyphomonadaceae bacterium]|nr:PRC-barrel domain-containing protein [Hyphomonadaceae bacterium]
MAFRISGSRRPKLAVASGAAAALLALFIGSAMAPRLPDGPVRLSTLTLSGLAGYPVSDAAGDVVGKVIHVDADKDGRARYVRIALNEGGQARIASFRAMLDSRARIIAVRLPDDLIEARSTSPSV